MKVAGYLVNTEDGLTGEQGLFYNYILARNGLFVRAENSLIKATVEVVPAEVRGLFPLAEEMHLLKGRVPRHLLDLAISCLVANPRREHYLAVVWNDGYHLRYPPQESAGSGVKYKRLPNTVVDIHSHGAMGAFFSGTDDADEQGLGLYIVIGKLNTLEPELLLRVGVYGYFTPVRVEEVFG
jgi:PRTRC genetic system protein A